MITIYEKNLRTKKVTAIDDYETLELALKQLKIFKSFASKYLKHMIRIK